MLDIVLIGFDVFSAILKMFLSKKQIDPFLQKCADGRGQKNFQNNFFSQSTAMRSYSKTLLRA